MEAGGPLTAREVVELYRTLEALGIAIWIDGGWGVDALLGEETRAHADLDIVIEQRDLPQIRALLAARGYADVPRDDTSPWNFVLGDAVGRLVDVHAIVFDAAGNGLYGPAERGVMYPADSLTGRGTIDGQPVRCISPEAMVAFHTGYRLRPHDELDVAALCHRFGLDFPPEYAHLKKPT